MSMGDYVEELRKALGTPKLKTWEALSSTGILDLIAKGEAYELFCGEVVEKLKLKGSYQDTRQTAKTPLPHTPSPIPPDSLLGKVLGEEEIPPIPPPPSPPSPSVAIPAELDTPGFRRAWIDYETHRKQKRSKITKTAATKLLAKLVAWGPVAAAEKLEQSITNGWTGVIFEGDVPPAVRINNDPKTQPIEAVKAEDIGLAWDDESMGEEVMCPRCLEGTGMVISRTTNERMLVYVCDCCQGEENAGNADGPQVRP